MSSPQPPAPTRLERLGEFLRLDPDNLHLLRDYAAEALHAGEFRACVMALTRVGTVEPLNLNDTLVMAQACRMDRRPVDALEVLAAAAARWPNDPWVALETARAHFSERSFDAALDALRDAPPDDPAAPEVTALRMRLLHHLDRLDEAIALFDLHPPPKPLAVARAALPLLMDLTRLEDAAALAAALAREVPAGTAPPYEACEPMAVVALDAGDAAAARTWLQAALSMRQDDGRVWLLDGLARLADVDKAPAIDALERATALMPGHAGSHLALGWALVAVQQLDGAEAAFEQGVTADPSFAEVHGSLAVVAAMRGDRAAAEDLIRKAARLDKACASALWARQLLNGDTDPAQVSQLAVRVIGQARRGMKPASPSFKPAS